ncbi:MAG TPA: D-alanyl-D-alanine carboxypeptidase family protein [Clostridiales bacterium]|nr:D-alanyl-D-alanine carboxypeptidase family protein [Clostridiales bacterium]HOL90820.1 D-alanyl-D-alanine carboxypeptidase family protein [Clostridiales bacterium]HPP34750.1 D-alanyl-D-alanine carboxypeptidase family protein [Clostridiales bacterium]
MKKLLTLAMIVLLTASSIGIAYAQPPSLDARAYILIDAQTGDVLCEKNSRETLYPASTTKIMTAILALELGDLDEVMTASQSAIDAIGYNGSNIGIIPGEKIRMENLLQAMLISSANEAANIIAENISGSMEEFVELMNKRAKELGTVETHFANPSGIHDTMHFTTAADLACISRYAMTLPKFREIVGTHSFTMPATNKHSKWPELTNSNKLMLNNTSDLYEINGIKTGFTGPAGNCLISSARNEDGMELIAVVMGVKNENAAENVRKYSKELLDYGFTDFERVELIQKGRVYRNIKVEDAADIYGLDLVTEDSLVRVLPKDLSQRNIQEISHINGEIHAPVNKGDRIGYVEFLKDGVSIGKVDLIAARDIEYKPNPVSLTALTQHPETILDNIYFKIGICCAAFIIFLILVRLFVKALSRRSRSRRYY